MPGTRRPRKREKRVYELVGGPLDGAGVLTSTPDVPLEVEGPAGIGHVYLVDTGWRFRYAGYAEDTRRAL